MWHQLTRDEKITVLNFRITWERIQKAAQGMNGGGIEGQDMINAHREVCADLPRRVRMTLAPTLDGMLQHRQMLSQQQRAA